MVNAEVPTPVAEAGFGGPLASVAAAFLPPAWASRSRYGSIRNSGRRKTSTAARGRSCGSMIDLLCGGRGRTGVIGAGVGPADPPRSGGIFGESGRPASEEDFL